MTPPLADAIEYVLYPQHVAGWGIPKRLVDDAAKLEAGLDYALLIVGPDATLHAFEFYSGVALSKEAYSDPRIEE